MYDSATSMTADELKQLFHTVFLPRQTDKVLTILVDVPDEAVPDTEDWSDRRALAYDWWVKAISFKHELGLERTDILYYPNVGSNNNDLPDTLFHWGGQPSALTSERLGAEGMPVPLADVLTDTDLIVALTEFSATAPCKMLAKQYGFRGTTMPGFVQAMLPSLQLDYQRVHERILAVKQRLDRAIGERIRFAAGGVTRTFQADLRHRTATASSGMFHDDMVIGNLPSGEAYIVPYEGERDGEPSTSHGEIPVQFGREIVVYAVEANRAVGILSQGPASDAERAKLIEEPAYGNIAEIGHGILGDFGCRAVGNLLMDEKLGLHLAFGRSEHFGGIVSPASFRNPRNVVHIDRVYVPTLQPDISILDAVLQYPDGTSETIMENNEWRI